MRITEDLIKRVRHLTWSECSFDGGGRVVEVFDSGAVAVLLSPSATDAPLVRFTRPCTHGEVREAIQDAIAGQYSAIV